MRKSTRERALSSQTTHSFRMGHGYIDHAASLRPGQFKGSCHPAPGAPDGSRHVLRAPHGDTKVFAWVKKEAAWAGMPGKGHRMAFSADYLASHGWTYQGPHEPPDQD